MMWIQLQQARLLPTKQRIGWLSNMEIGILMLCLHILAGFCIKTHQSLQKYEKTERHMLVCTDCPQPPLVRTSRSQEHCARKCKKVKKNFTCRWVAFSVCFVFAWNPGHGFFMALFPSFFLSCCVDTVFTYFCCLSFVHLSTTSRVFLQGFQLSTAQQEMPLASLWPLHPRCAEAGQRQLYFVWKKR